MASNLFGRSAMRWVPVYNADSQPVPPFGLLAVTGVDTLGNFTVTRPATDSQNGLLISGPGIIPVGGYGQAHQTFPAIIAYDDGGDDTHNTPQVGETWGAVANAWTLSKGYAGFLILGGAGGTVNRLVNAVPITLPTGGVNLQTGTSYTIAQSDLGKLISFTNASAIAVTLPEAGTVSGGFAVGFGAFWYCDVENRGVGTVTITPTTSTIDGAASLALTTDQGVRIFSDGTNYYTQRGMGSGGGSGIELLDKAGSVVDAACISFQMDTNGVVTVAHLSPGHDQITVTNASATQRGVVSTTTQTMAGAKTWSDVATFVSGLLSKAGITLQDGAAANPHLLINTTNSGTGRVDFTLTNASGGTAGVLQLFGGTSKLMSYSGNASFLVDTFFGPGSLATGATTGFPFIPEIAGTPTAAPTSAGGGYTPICFDPVANKLWIWNSNTSAWVAH